MTDLLPKSPLLESLGAGNFAIHGDLNFESASLILDQSRQLFSDHDLINVDLSGVLDADSAGLALLLEWLSWANHYNYKIHYQHIPQRIAAIAEISEVDKLVRSDSAAAETI